MHLIYGVRWDVIEIGWALNPAVCPYKRQKRRNRGIHGKEDPVKTEADSAVMWPQAKECQEPPEAGRRVRILPRAFRGSVTLETLWFWTSGLQDCEGAHFCCVKTPSWWQFVTAALRNLYFLSLDGLPTNLYSFRFWVAMPTPQDSALPRLTPRLSQCWAQI